ncbi:MAG: DUF1499 domain-containing protein [Sulfitobacter sp.]
MWVWIVIVLVFAALAYVRLAPIDAKAVHTAVDGDADKDGAGYALRVLPATPGLLARLDAAMMAEPATTRLAGSVAEGRISYVSRSKMVGFPDYTTVEERGGQIRLFARLRFGKSDLGVNRARLTRVIATVEAGG